MKDKGNHPARVPRSRKRQDKNLKQVPVSFGAYPEEIERWKKAAKEADRTLSWWIRSRLLAEDFRDDQLNLPLDGTARQPERSAVAPAAGA